MRRRFGAFAPRCRKIWSGGGCGGCGRTRHGGDRRKYGFGCRLREPLRRHAARGGRSGYRRRLGLQRPRGHQDRCRRALHAADRRRKHHLRDQAHRLRGAGGRADAAALLLHSSARRFAAELEAALSRHRSHRPAAGLGGLRAQEGRRAAKIRCARLYRSAAGKRSRSRLHPRRCGRGPDRQPCRRFRHHCRRHHVRRPVALSAAQLHHRSTRRALVQYRRQSRSQFRGGGRALFARDLQANVRAALVRVRIWRRAVSNARQCRLSGRRRDAALFGRPIRRSYRRAPTGVHRQRAQRNAGRQTGRHRHAHSAA